MVFYLRLEKQTNKKKRNLFAHGEEVGEVNIGMLPLQWIRFDVSRWYINIYFAFNIMSSCFQYLWTFRLSETFHI